MRCEDDVVHRQQRVPSWEYLAVKVVEARPSELPRAEGSDQCVHVVQFGAGSVQKDRALTHPRELFLAEEAKRLGGYRSVE